jgi:hypothetical protein
MTNEIALIPSRDELAIYESIAKYAADSKHFQNLGGVAGMMCIALYAREIGVSPMMAIMGGFSNVQGKITMSAELMGTLIRRNGHKLEILESTSTVCRIKGTRADTGESYTASFTIEEAQIAGLVKPGSGWQKYPSDMLFARTISRLRRRLFSDIATRAYVEGEIEYVENEADKGDHSKATRFPDKEPLVLKPEEFIKPKENVLKAVETMSIAQVLELEKLIGEDVEFMNRVLQSNGKQKLSELEESEYWKIKEALSIRQNQK